MMFCKIARATSVALISNGITMYGSPSIPAWVVKETWRKYVYHLVHLQFHCLLRDAIDPAWIGLSSWFLVYLGLPSGRFPSSFRPRRPRFPCHDPYSSTR